ncbi:hypothetical protein GCM10025857_06260 [Alicyclobacillus contaminans]|nr:hypothetical protein GCM10025857_06260 [Alicyclobacillus contaminans]
MRETSAHHLGKQRRGPFRQRIDRLNPTQREGQLREIPFVPHVKNPAHRRGQRLEPTEQLLAATVAVAIRSRAVFVCPHIQVRFPSFQALYILLPRRQRMRWRDMPGTFQRVEVQHKERMLLRWFHQTGGRFQEFKHHNVGQNGSGSNGNTVDISIPFKQ